MSIVSEMGTDTSLYPPGGRNRKRKSHLFSRLLKSLFFLLISAYFASAGTLPEARTEDSLKSADLLSAGYRLLLSEKYDSASISFGGALELCRRLGHWRHVAYSLNAIAECQVREDDFDAAYTNLIRARAVEREHLQSCSAEVARTEDLIGGIFTTQERFPEAADALERSVEIRNRLRPVDSLGLAASYVSLGNLWRKAGNFDLAMRSVGSALAILSQKGGDHQLELAQTLVSAGSIQSASGEYDSGISYLSRALAILQSRGRSASALKAQIYIWLGACCANKGEYDRALDLQKKALEACTLVPKRSATLGNCYALIGEQYANRGDYEKAVEYLTQALQVMEASLHEHHSSLAAPLSLLAKAYLELKQTARAIECVNQAIAIREKSLGVNHPALRYSYKIKGDILRRKGESREALNYYRKALDICERLDHSVESYDGVRLLIAMGSTDVELGRLHQADSLLHLALDRGSRPTTVNLEQTAIAHKSLGDLSCKKGKYSTALREYQQSIIDLCSGFTDTTPSSNPSPAQVRNLNRIVPVLASKGKTFSRLAARTADDQEQLLSALKAYEAALDISDAAQRTLSSTDAKLFNEEGSSSLHEAAVDLAVRLFRISGNSSYRERAFALAEQSRAQVLLETINRSHVDHFAGIPDSTLKTEGALRAEVNSCDIRIDRMLAGFDSPNPERLSRLNDRRFAAREGLDRLDEQWRREYPAFYSSRLRSPMVSLDSLRHMLGSRCALIEYFVGKSNLYVFVVKESGLQLVAVPDTHVAQDVRGILGALKSIDEQAFLRYGARLYQSTIAPIRRALHGITRLVLVPDGSLCYLPFEVLPESVPAGGAARKPVPTTSLPYLVRSFDITYSYSASFYATCLQQGQGATPPESFAGFAPVFADSDHTNMLLASEMLSHGTDPSILRSISVDGKHFSELKYSEDEVQTIGNSFRTSGMPVLEFLRGRATEEAFKERAGSSKFVHVATHGLINEEHPRLSGLLFSPAPDSTTGDDGILYAGEAYNLKLDADLLVLSSCESGVGKLIRGEGVMAITRGFFYAGARNIVVSLWRVFDKQTGQLMKEFYKYILGGASYSEALRQAKLRMIENPSTSFPSKWAGFILLGQ
jgi:CHAT domain-containing protein/tetratricopeptide (TPR) repeat protein